MGQAAGASASGVQLLEQTAEVAQAVLAGGVLQRLVLRQHVDEPLAQVVAVLPEQVFAAVAQALDDISHLAFGRERLLRHWAAAARSSGAPPGGRTRCRARRPARRPGNSARGARCPPQAPAPRSAWSSGSSAAAPGAAPPHIG